ncbi:nucleoside-diphosphate-sugar epimerase [Sphingobium xanthum]|nr:nucleoside-diphosphate-sugar epimerase [Sphingobium sp. B2D3C]MCW2410109.1 nucleoside-diphosphate-sugar epimerase [Sphingobium xanthum]
MLIFGLGYTATRLAEALRSRGWTVEATGRAGTIAFDDDAAVTNAMRRATHILSSVPPTDEGDPVLQHYGALLEEAPAGWIGYLSSTGVYGDTGGAWVDESAPVGKGRRNARAAADLAWQNLGARVRVFRLPGIYGPGRSALDRVREGRARKIDLPDQIFSRIHVEDIVSGILAGMAGRSGVYNLADDMPCSQNDVIVFGCALLGLPVPPMQSLEDAGLSPAARAFYSENRRVANGKAKRLLGWEPRFPDYRRGLAACLGAEGINGQPPL